MKTLSRARPNVACTLTCHTACPILALYAMHQELDLHPLLQQIRGLGGSADMVRERAIDDRVTAAELRLSRRSTTPTGTADSSRSATERGEEDIDGEWRWHDPSATTSASAVRGLWGARYRPSEACFLRLARSQECVAENTRGASDRGDDRFGVAIREETRPLRRRTFRLKERMPRIHQPNDGVTEWRAHRRRQFAVFRQSATFEVQELSLIHI